MTVTKNPRKSEEFRHLVLLDKIGESQYAPVLIPINIETDFKKS